MNPAPPPDPELTTDQTARPVSQAGAADSPSTVGDDSTNGRTTDPDVTAARTVAAESNSGDPRPPAIPGYEIEAVLGRGGMGVVYKARHLTLKRTVALKMVLAGGHAGPGERARFRTEAEAVARLQHPNIVQIHEVGEADGFPYCALEFVDGGTLAGKLNDGPLPPRDAAKLVEELARAMQLAHSRNVVHRDLKPANVLMGVDGKPKITDFGLARQLDTDSGQTQDGAVMGTPSYMAPEQASGHTHEAGPAADVYALGAILYHCLTGRPPFKGRNVAETLEQVRTREPEPPSRSHPATPPDLETVCLKCLRKEPEKRYSSAQELADDLARFLRHEPVAARPLGRAERFRLWWRRNPALAPLLAALVVLVLATAVTAVVVAIQFSKLANDLTDALKKAKDEQGIAKTERENAITRLGQTQRALGLSMQAEAMSAWNAGNVAQARERLAAVDPSARFWEWEYLHRLFHPAGFYPEPDAGVTHVAWSPDGGTLAAGTTAGKVVLRDGEMGAVRLRFPAHKDGILGLAFAPDGRHLATAGVDGTARVWVVSDGRLHRELKAVAGKFTTLVWQPHGNWIAIGCADGRIRLWDGLADKERPPLPAPAQAGAVSALASDPAGRTLARATGTGELALVPVDGSPPKSIPGRHMLLSLAFSPNGKLLAGGGDKLELWDIATGAVVRELPLYVAKPEGYRHLVTGLDFRGDGTWLASSCGGYALTSPGAPGPDTTIRLWDLNTGRQARTLRSLGGPIRGLRFSPDGQRLAGGSVALGLGGPTAGDGVGVWDVRGEGDHRLLSGYEFRPLAATVGPAVGPAAGRLVTVGGAAQSLVPGELAVWDLAGGARVAHRLHPTLLERVAFAPDGKTVATADANGTLDVWDAATLERVKTISGAHAGPVAALDYLPDGRLVSFGEDGLVRVRNPLTGAVVAELARPAERSVKYPTGAVSPRGECVAVGCRRLNRGDAEEVLLWRPGDGTTTPLGRVKGDTTALAFSADGALLAAVGVTGEVVVWQVETGTERHRFKAHAAAVTGVTFSPDGRRIATTAYDRAIRVWDAETGREALALTGPAFAGDTLRFTLDGRRLVAAGGGGLIETMPFGGEVCVWDAAPFADTPPRPDPAWHATRIVVGITLDPTGLAFHGRYAVRQPLPFGVGYRLVEACGDVIRQARPDDPRLPAFREQLRATCDIVAGQSPDDPEVRRALVANAVAVGSSDPIQRGWWERALAARPLSAWTVIAAGAYLDGDPDRVLAASAKGKGDTPLDAALAAWALGRKNDPMAKAALDRARELEKGKADPLLKELIGE